MELLHRGRGGRCLITDLASTNGTYVNGRKLRPFTDVECRAGDVVAFGEEEVAFQLVPAVQGPRLTALDVAVEKLLLTQVVVHCCSGTPPWIRCPTSDWRLHICHQVHTARPCVFYIPICAHGGDAGG